MKTMKPPKRATGFVLGRRGFSKISAVEGIRLNRLDKEFGDFDRHSLPAKTRRAILKAKYGAKS